MPAKNGIWRTRQAVDIARQEKMDTINDILDINHEHPEYAARRAMWRQYRDLYVGGEQFKVNAEQYLIRRQKEPGDVFSERLLRCFYENYIGSIVDWYAATLFRREAVLTFDGTNERAKKFFGDFTDDCDRRGSNLTEFFRKQFIEALVCGKSYALIDFPRLNRPAGTRAEEDERGASRAYLVSYSADELINWSFDEHGHYEWVVLRTQSLKVFVYRVGSLHSRFRTLWTRGYMKMSLMAAPCFWCSRSMRPRPAVCPT